MPMVQQPRRERGQARPPAARRARPEPVAGPAGGGPPACGTGLDEPGQAGLGRGSAAPPGCLVLSSAGDLVDGPAEGQIQLGPAQAAAGAGEGGQRDVTLERPHGRGRARRDRSGPIRLIVGGGAAGSAGRGQHASREKPRRPRLTGKAYSGPYATMNRERFSPRDSRTRWSPVPSADPFPRRTSAGPAAAAVNLSDDEFWGLPLADRRAPSPRCALPRPPFFASRNPVRRAGAGYYALVRHADVVEASRNPEVFSSGRARPPGRSAGRVQRVLRVDDQHG